MRKPRSLTGVAALAVAVLLGAVSDVAAQRAARTRSGGGGSSGGPKVASGARSGGATRVATGRATYGYYGHRHHGYPGGYYGYYGYYGYGPYYYGSWYPGYWYPGYWYWGWPVVYQAYRYYPVEGVLPARIETDVKPKRARVFVDGVEVGEARDYNGNWDVLELRPGRRTIELRADGYLTLRLAIDAESGSTYRIEQRLERGDGLDPRSVEPAPAEEPPPSRAEANAPRIGTLPPPESGLRRGLLRLSVQPADAAVYLDGEFLARADELERLHGAIPVAAGVHVVEVVRPGYEGQTREIDVAGEQPVSLTLSLERKVR